MSDATDLERVPGSIMDHRIKKKRKDVRKVTELEINSKVLFFGLCFFRSLRPLIRSLQGDKH